MTQTVDEFVEANGGTGFLELPRVAELVELAKNLEAIAWAAVEHDTQTMQEMEEVGKRRWIFERAEKIHLLAKRNYERRMQDQDKLIEQAVAIRIATLTEKYSKALYDLQREKRKRFAA